MKLIISKLVIFGIILILSECTQARLESGYSLLDKLQEEDNEAVNLGKMHMKSQNRRAKKFQGYRFKSLQSKKYITDLSDATKMLEGWLTISSPAFRNRNFYPSIDHQEIPQTDYQRDNPNFASARNQGAWADNAFYFKARGHYIYYSSTKDDTNVLDSIVPKHVTTIVDYSAPVNKTDVCFNVQDIDNNNFKICAENNTTKLEWMCSLQNELKEQLDYYCTPPEERTIKNQQDIAKGQPPIEIKKLVQNVIIIPTAAKQCNENWNYINKGQEWECTCKEGRQQSPIDLPMKENAELSSLTPMFSYDIVSSNSQVTTVDGMVESGKPVRIRYDKGALRIYHPNLGKIVALDGAVFVAEEISFHTPSEHKLNGVQYDMEMQIVHYGRSKGDISKQYILSFMFKQKPGVYNKFLDKLDFFNLPNPLEPFMDLQNDIYIPNIFYNTEDLDIPVMKSFSFFTYDGSLTIPPCTERTTHIVAADPIPLSNTVLTMFKEALKTPDVTQTVFKENSNNTGKASTTTFTWSDPTNPENNRDVQPLNGRVVYVFDHRRFGCEEFKPKPKNVTPSGHYEKHLAESTDYVFVPGEKPSGLPGALLVSEAEALGQNIA
jgi:carbonic anhydrase